MTWYYIFKLWFRLLGILRYHNDKTRSKNVVVDIRKTNWEINSEAEVKESRDSHLLVLQPGSKWYMRRAHFYRCPFSLHFQVLFLCIGRWNEDILFAFKPKGMPSVLKDGCALESLKARGEAAIKYDGFWHSIALPFSAAAKSEQLLLAFPCHFPASWKEVSSVFSLRIFPLAGHLDPSSSCILTRHFLYLVNDMIDTWDYQRQTLFPRVARETKTQRFIQPMWCTDHGIFPPSKNAARLFRAWTRERGEGTEITICFYFTQFLTFDRSHAPEHDE